MLPTGRFLSHVGLTGIRRRLLVPILSVTAIALTLMIGSVVIRSIKSGRESAELALEQMGYRYAGEVKMALDAKMAPARTLALVFKTQIESGVTNRALADSALKRLAETDPQILGSWTVWEPDAYDGRDAAFANTAGSDSSGRFISYWRRSGNNVNLESLRDYDVAGAGDYYQIAYKSGSEAILAPYDYELDGKSVLMTSLVVPVTVNGSVRGVVGVDLTLQHLQAILDPLRPYETGFVSLIAQDLTYAAHEDPSLLGKDINARIRSDSARTAILEGRPFYVKEHSDARNADLLRQFVPIFIGNTSTPWSLVTQADEKAVLSDANNMRNFIIGIGVLMTILLGLVVARVIGRLVRPISDLAAVARRVASGDVTSSTEHRSDDEVGELAEAFRALVSSQQELTSAALRLAKGDADCQVTVRSEADVLGSAVVELRDTVQALTRETSQLVTEAVNGNLSARGEPKGFHGAYRTLIQGINDTLDAIVTPVQEAASQLSRLANRDLTARMQGDYRGDHALMKTALNQAAASLDTAFTQVAATAENVSAAGSQISAGSQSLAAGASEQAASLEEIASSLQEMVAMATQSAGNAGEARQLADAAHSDTSEGVLRMEQLTTAIHRIKTSSDETAKIIRSIDEIAFQTNLLALNAAVEAARAGDAGRGFAVVAEEVRALALRSAEAARSTSALIEEAVTNANDGVKLNDSVLQSLGKISSQMNRVSEVVGEIAAASEQQAQGVTQINAAVEQMNSVTQTVAANAEESASAATELESQAQGLNDMVQTFTISDKHHQQTGQGEEPMGSVLPVSARRSGVSARNPRPYHEPARRHSAEHAGKPRDSGALRRRSHSNV